MGKHSWSKQLRKVAYTHQYWKWRYKMHQYGIEEDEVMEELRLTTAGILPTEKCIGFSREILLSKCRNSETQVRAFQKQSIPIGMARKERKRLRSILQAEQSKPGFQRLKRIFNLCKAGALSKFSSSYNNSRRINYDMEYVIRGGRRGTGTGITQALPFPLSKSSNHAIWAWTND